jgi:hypothetical protein
MHETKESGLSAVSAACCIGCLCDYSSLEDDLITTHTDCAKICRHIALQSHDMRTLHVYFARYQQPAALNAYVTTVLLKTMITTHTQTVQKYADILFYNLVKLRLCIYILHNTIFKLLVKLSSIVSKLLGRKLDTRIYHPNYIQLCTLRPFMVLTKHHKSCCIILLQTHKYRTLLVRFTRD